ncbi:MAG: SDR family oxidoreductase [Actinomycetota bacterium]|nr:SDR family oxidoreductase [Actinomycetota bacterium]
MDLKLSDQVVLLSGGSGGIGSACAHTFVREGCAVAVAGRDPASVQETVDAIRASGAEDVAGFAGDAGSDEDVAEIVRRVVDRFGRVDVYVGTSGSVATGALADVTPDQWLAGFSDKLVGYVRFIRHVAPVMEAGRGGSIVLVMGNGGVEPRYWELAPGAVNAAGINLCRSLATDLGRRSIRVNSVSPGPVETKRWDAAQQALAHHNHISFDDAGIVARHTIPRGTLGSAQEVADVIVFLASPLAGYVNGANIVVDGGQRVPLMDFANYPKI